MTEPFLGEIRVFSFPTPPKGWAYCDGASLPVQQNSALYSLLGVQFGGNQTNFNLPDFQGRVALGTGKNPNSNINYATGNIGGALTAPVAATMMPAHQHGVAVTTVTGDTLDPTGGIMAQASQGTDGGGNIVPAPSMYGPASTPLVALNAAVVSSTGGGQAHPNVQPYTTVNFCIALAGDYPPRP